MKICQESRDADAADCAQPVGKEFQNNETFFTIAFRQNVDVHLVKRLNDQTLPFFMTSSSYN